MELARLVFNVCCVTSLIIFLVAAMGPTVMVATAKYEYLRYGRHVHDVTDDDARRRLGWLLGGSLILPVLWLIATTRKRGDS